MAKEIKIACKGAGLLPINKLIDFQGDLKKITPENMQKLKNNIIKNNFSAPIFIWKKSDKSKAYILDGHSRVKALLELQKEGYKIPAKLPIDYIKADNKKEAKEKLLGIASQYGIITEAGLMDFINEADLDIESLIDTIEIPDIDIVFPEEETIDDDEIPEKVKTITKMGDLWELNGHRVLCGDSTDIEQVNRLVNNNKINMAVNDPPYGINIVKIGKIGGDKSFGKTTGKRTSGYVGADSICKANIYKKIKNDDSIETALKAYIICKELNIKKIILWGGNYYAHKLKPASCWIIWDKETAGTFGDGEIAWTNIKRSIGICRHKWSGMIKASEHGNKRIHPTQKPIALYEWIFEKYGCKDIIILDLFLGSGSTLIACEKTDRICYGMEIEPQYCDVIVQRYKDWCVKNERKIKIKLNGKIRK